jgi:hypothetical protein
MDQQLPVSGIRALSRHRPYTAGTTRRELTMRKLIILVAAAALVATGSLAQAGSLGRPCTNASQDKWLSIDALQAKVQALGFTVHKAKLKNACGEIYATDKAGARVELFVDPTNGDVVGKL